MDSEKKRSAKRRSLEAGREMLARYKASLNRNMDINKTELQSDDDHLHNDGLDQTIDQQSTSMLDSSYRDTTQSSVSVSEGEADDFEAAESRLVELQEALKGKQAVIESLSAEMGNMRADASSPSSSQSHNSSIHKDDFLVYKAKLQEFEQAVLERDKIIQHLTSLLEQTIAARDSLKAQLLARNTIPVQSVKVDGPVEVQKRISDLEQALNNHVEAVNHLNVELNRSRDYIKALEAEKSNQATEAAEMQQQCKIQVEKIKKNMEVLIANFAAETNSKAAEHEAKFKELEQRYQAEIVTIKQSHEEQYKVLFERYNTELPALETKHAKELHVFQTQLSSYKRNIESLKAELENSTRVDQQPLSDINNLKMQLCQCAQDKEMLQGQIQIQKQQIDDLTSKCVAVTSVLNSKESIEKSLEEALINIDSLKRENEDLKFQHDDLSARYAALQAVIENNQAQERRMTNRIFDLEKSLSRMSGMNMSMGSEFNTTSYQTFNEDAVQFQVARQHLEEKESLEKKLMARIADLEECVNKANRELEEANMEKRNYEKQLKDTKNRYDKIISDVQSAKATQSPQPFPSSLYFHGDSVKLDVSGKSSNDSTSTLHPDTSNDILEKIEAHTKEIAELKEIIRRKDMENNEISNKLREYQERMKQLQVDRNQLKQGLVNAWEECTELESRMDQTLSRNESKFNESSMMSNLTLTNNAEISTVNQDESANSSTRPDLSIVRLKLENICQRQENVMEENAKLREENASLLKMQENVEALKKSLDELNAEKALLVKEIASLTQKNREDIVNSGEINKNRSYTSNNDVELSLEKLRSDLNELHSKEMEELRTYFEEKCLQMEKQYSEEIFSQQSKKISEDSEAEELTDDLYYGGAGDCVNASRVFDHSKRAAATEDRAVDQLCQTEWDVAVENVELNELRTAYKHQLEEQVALAKRDIVNALQEQIQALIAVEQDTEENWPSELLELRNKFTNNARREMEKLKESHALEIVQLRDEHSRTFSRTIERYQAEINRLTIAVNAQNDDKQSVSLSTDNNVIIKQRDNLYKTCVTLKGLIAELVKYFATCEEELNNTLITEVLKRQSSSIEGQQSSAVEKIVQERENDSSSSSASLTSPKMKIKRVHFAPQSSQISRMISRDTGALFDLIDEESHIAQELRSELDKCLQRMKTESAQIFGISLTPGDAMLDTLSKQVAWTTKVNEELSAKLLEAESAIEEYQQDAQQLKLKITDLQQKLIAMDTRKEIISEGYGEHDETGNETVIPDYTQLHEKARLAIMSGAGDNSYLLQLLEEFWRYHEKSSEETKKEKEDLQQQIEAADKQLRSTRKFLEEQASEREIERDDAARQIHTLHEQLKEREREKERDLRITSEVEALESQIREMSSIITDGETKRLETEAELKAAVDKIFDLREIITASEQQIQAKMVKEDILENKIEHLQQTIASQQRQQQELLQELERIKIGEDSQFDDHVKDLEEELRKHKLSTEHFNVNSTVLKQMKSELREMQLHLDKRIKELEAYHMCGSNSSISQRSEDVSIRDQIDATRCPTPDDPNGPPTLPLDQLLKLKEKLMKHTRAEEVAFKRIKDLEMQLSALKLQNEELQAEREILQETASEQLFQLETMRGRLEQHKQSAPFVQRQATSRLEIQLHEANTKILAMEQAVTNKELELKDLRLQLDRSNEQLYAKQQEIASVVQTENNMMQELRDRLTVLEHEKRALESKLSTQERAQQIPQLLDSMLADKNDEIDHLKEQLSKKERQLEALTSLNMEDNQAGKQNEPKNSARTLSDILSIHSECEDVSEAIREAPNSLQNPLNFSNIKGPSIIHTKDQLDGSAIPSLIDLQKSEQHVPLLDLGSQQHSFGSPSHVSHPQISLSSGGDITKSDFYLKSPPIGCSTATNFPAGSVAKHSKSRNISRPPSTKKSDSELQTQSLNSPRIEDLENQLKSIHQELQAKSATLAKREVELDALQKSLDELRAEFKDSIDQLQRDNVFYKSQYELCQESESKIKRDLEEVEDYLKVKTEELEVCKEKIQVNERILIDLQNENCNLKDEINRIREENATYHITIREKAQELKNLKEIIYEKDITIETINTRNEEFENENKQLYEFKTKYEACKRDFIDSQAEIKRLTHGINHRNEQIQRLEDMARRSSFSGASSISDRDHELHHLQECLKEKEKVICEMSNDSKALHRSLETIRNKMKESGNVEELRKKLRAEKMFNAELTKMVANLKHELEILKDESIRESTEGADIEDMVQRELNLSADLDKKIMDAIESESEEISARKIEMHSCNSLTIKPVEQDLEKIMQQYTEVRKKLKQANKLNDNLKRQKDDLEIERDMLKTQIAEYEDRIMQIKADFENETKKNIDHIDRLATQKAKIRELENQLLKEKTAAQNAQLQDSELLSKLRLKLTSSLQAEEQLRNNLTSMREQHKLLQVKFNTLKEQNQSGNLGGEPSSPTLEEADQTDLMLAEKYEIAERKLIELTDNLKAIEVEKNRLEKDLEIQLDERETLLSRIALAENTNEHLEDELKRLREDYKAIQEDNKFLQKRIDTMLDADSKRQRSHVNEVAEIKNLKVELKNLRAVMKDLEYDSAELKRQLSDAQVERNQLNKVAMALRKSEGELVKQLNVARSEEEKLKEHIAELQNDLRLRMRKECEMSKCDFEDTNISAQLIQKITELNSEIARYSNEKSILHDKLIRAREETEKQIWRVRELEAMLLQKDIASVTEQSSVDQQTVAKIQQLYAKFMRTDSKRKALAYQKRYLLCVIGGYQLSEDNTLSMLAQLTTAESAYVSIRTLNNVRKTPKARVKSAFLAILSIIRIKWMVQRWRTGVRKNANQIMPDYDAQNYATLYRAPTNQTQHTRSSGHVNALSNGNSQNLNYGHYVQRVSNIQQSLGLTLSESKPNQMPSE